MIILQYAGQSDFNKTKLNKDAVPKSFQVNGMAPAFSLGSEVSPREDVLFLPAFSAL